MGPGETFSVIALAIMAIVITGIMASIRHRRMALRQRELEINLEMARLNHEAALAAARDTSHNIAHEQRLRVLERIVTDQRSSARGEHLAREIAALAEPDPTLN